MTIKGLIYVIENKANNKCYIGSTKNKKQRWAQHASLLKHGKGVKKMRADVIEYGFDHFVFKVIEEVECETKNDLLQIEYKWMGKLDSIDNGYNTNCAIEFFTRQRSPQFCQQCGRMIRLLDIYCAACMMDYLSPLPVSPVSPSNTSPASSAYIPP